MNLAIVGSGYVGLVTSVGLAANGHHVTCVDRDHSRVSLINHGICPLYEPGLDSLLQTLTKEKRSLIAVEDYNEITDSEVIFVCVGTFSESTNKTDFTNIIDAASQIGRVLQRAPDYRLVVIKSTVIPGTTEEIIIPTLEKYSSKKAGREFGVAVNPEFLQEGSAIQYSQSPDRVIIGEHDQKAGDTLERLCHELSSCPVLRTNMRTAEMIKYATNAFLATKISFINEIGNLCKNLGIDVYEVVKGMGCDPRIGDKFLNAGAGFGGSCLPKDLAELVLKAHQMGYEAQLLRSVLKVNDNQALRLVEIAKKRLGSLEHRVIAVLGLAFKPNTDDVRAAPALKVIPQLLEEGASVKVYDPVAMRQAKMILPDGVKFCASASDAINDSDGVLIVTEWDEFKDESLYRGKLVIDGRRTLNPEKARQVCRYYEGVCW